jgi:galactose mutarotase-like enzyme
MLHILENDALRVAIDDHGAQLMSIIGKKDGTEYLWQGDARYWGDRAIMLFPICGRLEEGRYTYGGKSYDMSIHGFIRNVDLTVTEKTDTTLTLSFKDNEQTLAQYPFAFLYEVTFTLDGDTLAHDFKVTNTGAGELPFGIGGHPGFNVPMVEGSEFSDYYLEFSEVTPVKKVILTDRCFMTDALEPFALEGGKVYKLHHDMFDHDAIFLTDMAKSVTLTSDKTDKAVTVSYTNMPYLGLWHKPKTDAPYICIEPWNGMPADDGTVDAMETKKYMVRLAAGESEAFGFTIAIRQ